MKKLFLLVSMLMLFVLSCGSKDKAETKTDGEAKEKVLRVGTNPEFKPFEYVGEGGKTEGFDIDLMNMIAEELGYKVEWKIMAFDGLIPAMKNGELDAIIAGMSVTEERLQAVDFSDEYYKSKFAYVKLKGDTTITKPEDLKDKKVGAQLGTIQEQEARKLSSNVIPNEAITALILEMKNKNMDAIVLEDVVASSYVSENPFLEIFATKDMADNGGTAIAFDKGKNAELIKEVNGAIKKLQENGKYDELLKKYNLK
ncbi:MAG: basic amino acid ABC transporter substrate-binding protein [Sebaldella sp.]|nr:basic amino acid ABC transporter substrate-binding protein [Sebaldella sp.]